MITNLSILSLRHQEFKNDPAALDKFDKATDGRSFAVHNLLVVKALPPARRSHLRLYEHRSRMFFFESFRQKSSLGLGGFTVLDDWNHLLALSNRTWLTCSPTFLPGNEWSCLTTDPLGGH